MTIPRPDLAPALAGSRSLRPRPAKRRGFGLFRTDAEAGAISEINTTPLIDVMLVLLIMFIITIPMATHKVPLDLPQSDPLRRAGAALPPARHRR